MSFSCTIWDVGLGCASFVKTNNGKGILFDCGSSDTCSPSAELDAEYLLGPGVELDCLVISHPHEDHISDLPNIIANHPPTVFTRNRSIPDEILYSSGRRKTNEPFRTYYAMDKRYIVDVYQKIKLDVSENWGGVTIQTWSCSPGEAGNDLNNLSVLSMVSCPQYAIIFPGDLEPAGWRALFNKYIDLKRLLGQAPRRILIAPHHGRWSSTHESTGIGIIYTEFLNVIRPHLVIIPDQYGNDSTDPDTYRNHVEGDGLYVTKHRNLLLGAIGVLGMSAQPIEQTKVLTTKRWKTITIYQPILGRLAINAYGY